MKQAFLKKFLISIGCALLVVFYMPRSSADDKGSDKVMVVDMIAGDIQSVIAHNLTRVSVTNPDVADISDAQSDKITLLAKKAGETALFLWDDSGKRSIKVRVVNEDLKALRQRVQTVLDEAGITGVLFEENLDIGKLVLTGDLIKEDLHRLDDVLEPYSDNLLNLVKEEKSEDLIEVDMQVVEISTTLEKNLGLLWGNTTSASSGVPASGATPTVVGTNSSGTNSGAVALNYQENPPTVGTKFKDLFKIGSFTRQSTFIATVNALLQEGKARLISKPRLVVVSGKQASFLVGGEIPQENTTTNSTGGAIGTSTTYSQYGVNMTVTPTVRKGKIDVVLNLDIRDVDNSSSFSTNQNPAFITRTASTDLLMDNKQTIVMAGFIKYQDSVTLTEVPFLSKIPVVGALFRNRDTPADSNTEMVIILTPIILTEKKIAQRQLVMPTPEEREADAEVNAKYEHEPLSIRSDLPADLGNATNNMESALPMILPDITSYARMVQEKISNALSYPQDIKGKALEGTVKLKVHILKSGSLGAEEVVVSSGNPVLDQEAMHAAKAAAPYDAFMPGMQENELIFTVPIVYNKFASKGKSPSEKVIAAY